MEFLQVGPQRHWTQPMNPFCFRLGTKLPITRLHFRSLFGSCSISASLTPGSAEVAVLESQGSENAVVRKESSGVDGSRKGRVRVKFTNAQLKQNWIDSLSCPSMVDGGSVGCESAGLDWVLGIDPDTCGAVALLKPDVSDYTAQVFDSPSIPVVVGKRVRKRLDPKSILQLLQSLDAPAGTKAYIEQSLPFPQDGKQGWWSAGYGYGLWIGSLLASGFSVIPVPSKLWKNGFELSGSRSSKDDSRLLASKMFPTLSAQLRRKKDHGRAEALLIAAYGKGLRVDSDLLPISKD